MRRTMRNAVIGLALLIMGMALVAKAADGDERFSGGTQDGYAKAVLLNVPVPQPVGTIIMVL